MRSDDAALASTGLPWKLLGVHAGRLDMLPRDEQHDEVLGLNCTWYADVLMALTAPRPAAPVCGAAAAPPGPPGPV
jgi:hypothetical protein